MSSESLREWLSRATATEINALVDSAQCGRIGPASRSNVFIRSRTMAISSDVASVLASCWASGWLGGSVTGLLMRSSYEAIADRSSYSAARRDIDRVQ
jgi:hypothetical protein